jgi:hypothetical protein
MQPTAKRFFWLTAFGLLGLVAPWAAAPARATCGDFRQVKNGFDSYWSGLPENNLIGFAWSYTDAAVQTGQAKMICRMVGEEISGGQCQPQAGSASDACDIAGTGPTAGADACLIRARGHPVVIAVTSAVDEDRRRIAASASWRPWGTTRRRACFLDWAHPTTDVTQVSPLVAPA